MEIDEHLKYTLYVAAALLRAFSTDMIVASSSIPARALANQWFRAGLRTTSCKQGQQLSKEDIIERGNSIIRTRHDHTWQGAGVSTLHAQ
jgi:hypothetical protein